jgi:aromatic ring hydroxylase
MWCFKTFLKLKQEASGYPSKVNTDEKRHTMPRQEFHAMLMLYDLLNKQKEGILCCDTDGIVFGSAEGPRPLPAGT